MSISTQQIQAVLRTYNKQLRLSGIKRRNKNANHHCLKDQADLWQDESKQHLSKQRRNKNRRTQ